jgi:hypothetical protein
MFLYTKAYLQSRRGRRILQPAALLSLVLLCGQVVAQTATPILVELFTSEGCSSCPPAESFLRALDSAQPVSGAQLIVLEEHVDYWDDQGWKDPFSSHLFTTRQSDYVDRLRVDRGPYTPQMVIDGSEAFVGSDRAQAGRAVGKALKEAKVKVEITSVRVENGKISLHINTGPLASKADVVVAVALDHAESQVLRGENGGRKLEHVAVVERLTTIGKIRQGDAFSKDANLDMGHDGQEHRIVIFVQQSGQGKILGAAMARVPQKSG